MILEASKEGTADEGDATWRVERQAGLKRPKRQLRCHGPHRNPPFRCHQGPVPSVEWGQESIQGNCQPIAARRQRQATECSPCGRTGSNEVLWGGHEVLHNSMQRQGLHGPGRDARSVAAAVEANFVTATPVRSYRRREKTPRFRFRGPLPVPDASAVRGERVIHTRLGQFSFPIPGFACLIVGNRIKFSGVTIRGWESAEDDRQSFLGRLTV